MSYGILISFTCFLTMGLAVRRLIAQPRICSNYLQFFIYMLAGFVFLLELFRITETYLGHHYNSRCLTLCMFSLSLYIIPLIFLNLKTLSNHEFEVTRNMAVHFIVPVSFCIIILLFFIIVDSDVKFTESEEIANILLFAIQLGVVTTWIIYNIVFLVGMDFSFNEGKTVFKKGIMIVRILSVGSLLIAFFTSFELFYKGAISTLALVFLALIIQGIHLANVFRHENNLTMVAKSQCSESQKRRLNNVDVGEVQKKLFHLFENEKIFCYEELNISDLAEELSISRHHLSEIFNVYMNKPFARFVNEYRIKEACYYLQNEPDRSILSISHAVGYNSPSSFYSYFKNETGITPTAFRQQVNSKKEFKSSGSIYS